MMKEFSKLDPNLQAFIVQRYKILGVVCTGAAVLWAAEVLGYFNFDLLMPTLLLAGGLLTVLNGLYLGSKKKK